MADKKVGQVKHRRR